jgi:Fe-S cluster assembly iron-binding protein IscA
MKTIIYIVIAFFFSLAHNSFGQFPPIEWGQSFPATSGNGNRYENSIRFDSDENLYMLTYSYGVTEFSLISGEQTYDCGSGSFVLVKRNPNGHTEWILPFPETYSMGFDVDNEQNVVLLAKFKNGGTQIDPLGNSNLVTMGNEYMLAKYSPQGKLVWHKTTNNYTTFPAGVFHVETDANNNIICCARYTGTLDFDFSIASSHTLSSVNSYDLFVAKYDIDGNFLWVRSLSSSDPTADCIALNNNGEIYIGGTYRDSLTYSNGVSSSTVYLTPVYGGDYFESFFTRINPNGSLQYLKTFALSNQHVINSIYADNSSVYILNGFVANVNMNPNSGTQYFGSERAKILRLTTNSTYVTYYPVAEDEVYGADLIRKSNGNFVVLGSYYGTRDLDPTAGNLLSTASSGQDLFISEFGNPPSNYLGTSFLPSTGHDQANEISISNNQNISIRGALTGSIDVDLTGNTYTLNSTPLTSSNIFTSYYFQDAPELNVLGMDSSMIVSGENTVDSANGTFFGDLCLNEIAVSNYHLVNTGTTNLTISNISLSGASASNYTLNANSGTIPPNDTLILEVTFNGTSVGVKSATVEISNTDSDESTYTFQIEANVHDYPSIIVSSSDSDNEICANDPITLTASGADNYTWSGSVVNGVPFAPSISNIYQVVGSTIFGCTDTTDVSIIVNLLPNVSVQSSDSDDSICLGDSVALEGQGAVNYSYSNGISNLTYFAPTSTNEYVISGEDNNGCINHDTIQITVNALPVVIATSSDSDNAICLGDSIQLYGSGASSYSFSNGVSNGGTFYPNTNDTYTIIGTDSNGCVDSSDITIIVNSIPTVSVTSNDSDNAICLNDSIQLIGSGAQSYSYSNGVQDQTDFYPTTTQNYAITGTDINGCENDTNITITVFSLPNVGVTSNDPNNAICLNDPIQLIGSGAVTYSYSNGIIDQTDFYPTSTQTYSVTGTDANGCSNTNDITITVNPLPTVSVTSNAINDEICLNDPIQLIGSGAVNYSYSNGVIDQTDFYPTSDDTYNVTGTDANGCQNTASIFVTVNALPTVSVVSNDADNAICLNDSIQLTASGASTYAYTNGVTDQVYFNPTLTSTYQVVGTDGNGCQDIDSIEIVVNALPVISITSSDLDNTICLNDSIQLTGSGAQFYLFDNGVQNGVYFYPTTSSAYNLTGTDTNGCEGTSQILISVNALPTVNVISSDVNDSICIGDSISLSGLGAQSYVYSGGVSDQIYFTPSATETFSITGTDVNGCIGSDSITIEVENLPNIDGGSDLFVCHEDSAYLDATGSGTITWTGNLSNGSYFIPSTSTTELICTAVSPSGCVNSDSITVEMGNQINTNTTIINVAIQAISNYDNYEWFDCQSGSTVLNGTQSSFFPSVDGEYAVVITDSDGCIDTSGCVIIDFLDVPNLTNTELHFFPNPTNGILKVSNPNQLKSIRVYDSFGRLLLTNGQGVNTIDLSGFATGQYLIKGTLQNGETIIERIIKE